MRPSLPSVHRLALRAGVLALGERRSVPTQAKRDADGLAVDARTFLSDTRAEIDMPMLCSGASGVGVSTLHKHRTILRANLRA